MTINLPNGQPLPQDSIQELQIEAHDQIPENIEKSTALPTFSNQFLPGETNGIANGHPDQSKDVDLNGAVINVIDHLNITSQTPLETAFQLEERPIDQNPGLKVVI